MYVLRHLLQNIFSRKNPLHPGAEACKCNVETNKVPKHALCSVGESEHCDTQPSKIGIIEPEVFAVINDPENRKAVPLIYSHFTLSTTFIPGGLPIYQFRHNGRRIYHPLSEKHGTFFPVTWIHSFSLFTLPFVNQLQTDLATV
jgi:hypothetical protein